MKRVADKQEQCEICGKPSSPYPNWLRSKGHTYHVGCLAVAYQEVKEAHRILRDRAYVAGTWGPWADGWAESYEGTQWGQDHD